MTLPTELTKALREASEQVERGKRDKAIALLGRTLVDFGLTGRDLTAHLIALREVLVDARCHSGMLAVDGLLGDRTHGDTIHRKVEPRARGRALEGWGDAALGAGNRTEATESYGAAADAYLEADWPVRAAILREKAGQYAEALTLWERVARGLEAATRPDDPEGLYALGLARYDIARACRELGRKAEERRALVAAVHALELAADQFERTAMRERAFDCYEVLIALGTRSGEFEHALEGHVNATRVLVEDDLRTYALQHYEDAIAHAEKVGELAAAASLAAELAGYGRSLGSPAIAARATRREAELHERVGDAVLARGGPPELAENAWLAAVVAYAEQRQFRQVGRLYRRLAELDLEPRRRTHYARAEGRHRDAADEPPPSAGAGQPTAATTTSYPDVWHDDLVEREQNGSLAAVCLDVVHGANVWSQAARLRALAVLLALGERAWGDGDEGLEVAILGDLAPLGAYPVLAPLEAAFHRGSPAVKEAVLETLQRFLYKRTFVTVRRGLDDPEESVRRRARVTLEALAFPHAVDPLARVVREHRDPEARGSALRALGRIDTPSAAEVLLEIFRHGDSSERGAALAGLRRGRAECFKSLVRPLVSELPPEARDPIRDLLAGR